MQPVTLVVQDRQRVGMLERHLLSSAAGGPVPGVSWCGSHVFSGSLSSLEGHQWWGPDSPLCLNSCGLWALLGSISTCFRFHGAVPRWDPFSACTPAGRRQGEELLCCVPSPGAPPFLQKEAQLWNRAPTSVVS